MSNWGRNYNNNRNQSYFQNSYQNTPQSRSYENWTNYGPPQQYMGVNQSFSQSSMTFVPNNVGTYNGEGGYYYQPGLEREQISLYNNVEISSEILARAANSQLTPTAGEFIPSSVFQSACNNPQPEPQTFNHSNNTPRNRSSNGNSKISKTSRTNGSEETSAMSNNQDHAGSHVQQRKIINKTKSHNGETRRQVNIEQSKAEGRKKLLEEAAGLVTPREDTSSSSRGPSSSSELTKWRTRGSGDKTNYNGDTKVFTRSTKSQDRFQQCYSPPTGTGSSPRRERNSTSMKGVDEAASQRERLTEQLNRGVLECLVCCEVVRQQDWTWSCHNCYHVLHLRCITKWANTSKSDNGWRCPACQNVTVAMPRDYLCFCGKLVNPDWNRSDTAHSCGEVCNRPKVLASQHYSCVHRCTLLCHPGPCPPCAVLVTRKCGCGASSQTVQCGQTQALVCGAQCGKPLSCGLHSCELNCHLGECRPCQVVIKQECFCRKERREVVCDGNHREEDHFSCAAPCAQQLSCGHHACQRTCHEGLCDTCVRDPSQVTSCFCGKTPLSEDQCRSNCLDPIPTCGQVCGKPLTCGQPSSPHCCKALCHEGPCPPCDQTTLVRCRCGYMDRELPCTELTTKADDARCQKKCTKKRTCGKHKCNQFCCIDVNHICPLPCNHTLSCGQHRCDQLCHRGHCRPCLESSFTELYCECGASVLHPPIPCGTKPPPCDRPCSRQHDCDHDVLHMCHPFPQCPPCGVLTSKYCYGKHELRKAVPCYMKEFSCGRPCGRALSCGRHKCIQPCHGGNCVAACRQPCNKPRELCGHPCNQPCHEGECLDTPCKENVVVTCECGHRSMSRPCYENNSEYQRIATSLLASKMADVQLGRSVNLADMQGSRKISIKTLECMEECRVMERNRRLAIGLQIRNPDLSAKLTPRYSDFMRGWAKKDPRFSQHVHDKLTELVKLAKESKQKSRSYSFETMNREKRQFVHEYCTHFGCESVAYDAEPKRNVVATAQRDKAWLPSYSLLEVVQREMGLRKVPLPNLNSSSQKPTAQSNVLPVRVALSQPAKPAPPDGPQIDYFDYNG